MEVGRRGRTYLAHPAGVNRFRQVVGTIHAPELYVGNGIEVDDHARTSDPYIYATGDVAEFPYLALERRMRVEHWDHAIQHGRAAGANMAGANHPYTTLPMFYSDFWVPFSMLTPDTPREKSPVVVSTV